MRRGTGRGAAVAALAGLVLAVATPAHAIAGYTISGSVTLPSGADSSWLTGISVQLGGDSSATVAVDPGNGKFTFTGLPNGSYTLRAYGSLFTSGSTTVIPNVIPEYFGGSYTAAGAATITIADANVTGNDIALDRGGILRGTIYLLNGQSSDTYNGIQVTATGPDGLVYTAKPNPTSHAYLMFGMVPGSYTASAAPVEYDSGGGPTTPDLATSVFGSYFNQPTTFGIAETTTTSGYTANFLMYKSLAMTGTVQLAPGADPSLLAGVTVTAHSEYYDPLPTASVDPDTGAWSLPGLAQSGFSLEFSGPGLVTQWRSNLTGVSSFLDLPPTVTFDAVTMEPGQAVSGTVTLKVEAGHEFWLDGVRVSFVSSGFTLTGVPVDPTTGAFTSSPLPPGDYTVSFAGYSLKTEYYRDAYDAGSATLVTVGADAPVTGINAVLSDHFEFAAAPSPTITGTRLKGAVLTAHAGAWSPSPDSFAYQWYRNGSAISGATKATYTLTASDSAKKITVKVTAAKSDYNSTSKTSAGATMPKFFTATPTPTMSGTRKAGHTLTAKPGTWSPKPTSFSYQWYRAGKPISKATKATYTLTSSDKGKKITVKVTAKKSGYGTVSVTSKSTTIAK